MTKERLLEIINSKWAWDDTFPGQWLGDLAEATEEVNKIIMAHIDADRKLNDRITVSVCDLIWLSDAAEVLLDISKEANR